MRRPWRRHPYVVASWRERVEWVVLPLICRVVGHPPQEKMYCTICRRCQIVLHQR